MLILDQLLSGLRDVCAAFPDKRKGDDAVYSMADIGMSAFSLFFMQSESFLAYQRSLEEGRKASNCQTLFGMAKIPTDNHIRAMLDPVPATLLHPAFDQTRARPSSQVSEMCPVRCAYKSCCAITPFGSLRLEVSVLSASPSTLFAQIWIG